MILLPVQSMTRSAPALYYSISFYHSGYPSSPFKKLLFWSMSRRDAFGPSLFRNTVRLYFSFHSLLLVRLFTIGK